MFLIFLSSFLYYHMITVPQLNSVALIVDYKEKYEREVGLQNCLDRARQIRDQNRATYCKFLGKGEKCWLPTYYASKLERKLLEDREDCYKRFK